MMTTPSDTPRTQQSWAEAVMETVTEEAEQRRIIGLYEPDEMVTALMDIGNEMLGLKRELSETKSSLLNCEHEERGGKATDWWSVAILERRKRKATERELSAATERLERLEAIAGHLHVAMYRDGKLIDECRQCGLDLRDPIHWRAQPDGERKG